MKLSVFHFIKKGSVSILAEVSFKRKKKEFKNDCASVILVSQIL